MADLMTHLATGLLLKAATRGRHTGLLLAGVVLPDLASRVPGLALSQLKLMGAPIPTGFIYGFSTLHMPLSMLPLCWLVALPFAAPERPRVWGQLALGCALHLGVDLLQRHWGPGYFLLFPFSHGHWELGLIGSEGTVWVAPILFPLSAAIWWLRVGRVGRGVAPDANAGAGGGGSEPK